MPFETIKETMTGRAISEDSEDIADRKIRARIAEYKIQLIGLSIAKVMMDIREDRENYKSVYDDDKLLQLLGDDSNASVGFMKVGLVNKNRCKLYKVVS